MHQLQFLLLIVDYKIRLQRGLLKAAIPAICQDLATGWAPRLPQQCLAHQQIQEYLDLAVQAKVEAQLQAQAQVQRLAQEQKLAQVVLVLLCLAQAQVARLG